MRIISRCFFLSKSSDFQVSIKDILSFEKKIKLKFHIDTHLFDENVFVRSFVHLLEFLFVSMMDIFALVFSN